MKLATKKYLCVLLCLMFAIPFFAVNASAAEQTSKLTLVYNSNDVYFEDLQIFAYRVADIGADGAYTLCGDFADYPVNVKVVKNQEEWRAIATTLSGYISADKVEHTAVATTDTNGEAVFSDLEMGLYLISGVNTEYNDLVYAFETFFMTLPRPDENGAPQYEVTAIPKYSTYVPEPDDIEYRVLKQWKDDGNEKRPVSVAVEIYKNGVLDSKQTLSAENDWSYSWTAKDDGSVWTVVERDVVEGYAVSVDKKETTFIITNTFETETPPPETGDTFVAWPYILAMFAFGAILVLLSVSFKKVKDE